MGPTTVGKADMMDASTTGTSTTSVPSVAADLLAALAEVRCATVAELNAQRGSDGCLELDSPEAVAVIAKLEAKYGRQLARVEDLEPEQLTTIEALAALISDRLGIALRPANARVSTDG
jgi:acyl carrier protein